ncbi:hypothetical protein NQZ70_02367 [Sorangium sp. Soce836]|nr:hypothetical protein NQZ70_02367 [Sorangium sp. Soce836]
MPSNFVMCPFISLAVKPMTWWQLVFTYLVPIILLRFA